MFVKLLKNELKLISLKYREFRRSMNYAKKECTAN